MNEGVNEKNTRALTLFFFSGACLAPRGGAYRLLAVNADRKGSEYVSAVEAFDHPIYGLQWHPEKVRGSIPRVRSSADRLQII